MLKKSIPVFQEAENRSELEKAVSYTTTFMDDYHVTVHDKKAKDLIRRIPLWCSFLENKLIVGWLIYGVDSSKFPFRQGDEIIKINGLTVPQLWKEYLTYTSVSNKWNAAHNFYYYVWTKQGRDSIADYVVKRGADTLSYHFCLPPWDSIWRKYKPVSGESRSSKVIHDSIAYVVPVEMSYSQFKRFYKKIKDKPYLILDCRTYGSMAMFGLLPVLNNNPQPVSMFYYPLAKYPGVFKKDKKENYFVRNKVEMYGRLINLLPRVKHGFRSRHRYKGKVFVLCNAIALSFGETVLMGIRKYRPNAIFIGTPTTGANGNVCTVQLPYGLSVNYSGIDFRWADGSQFQRIGIIPDVHVETTIDDFENEKDVYLQKALSLIESKQK